MIVGGLQQETKIIIKNLIKKDGNSTRAEALYLSILYGLDKAPLTTEVEK